MTFGSIVGSFVIAFLVDALTGSVAFAFGALLVMLVWPLLPDR